MISSPKPPDPYQTANAQAGANTDAAIAGGLINNINEKNPYGATTYTAGVPRTYKDSQGKTVTIPTQTRTTTLSGPQQAILDQQNSAQLGLGKLANTEVGNVTRALSTPFSTAKLPAGAAPINAPTLDTSRVNAPGMQTDIADAGGITKDYGSNDFSADRKRVEDAYLARSTDAFKQDESAMDQKLRNQGLAPGSEAYNTQFDQLRRQQTDARNQAIVFGGQEQSRLTGLEADRANFQNTAQAQQFGQNQAKGLFANSGNQANFDNSLTSKGDFNTSAGAQYGYKQAAADAKNAYRKNSLEEAYAMRNQPLNEALALASGTQVTAPQFSSPFQSGVNAAPIGQLISDNYQAQLDRSNGMASGLFGLLGKVGGAAITASDRRLKEHIKRLGTLANGLNLYRWTWRHNGKSSIGCMADEVAKVLPAAVHKIGGIFMVDYGMVIADAH